MLSVMEKRNGDKHFRTKKEKQFIRKLCPESAVVELERLDFTQIRYYNNVDLISDDSNRPSTSSKNTKYESKFNHVERNPDTDSQDWEVASVESSGFAVDDSRDEIERKSGRSEEDEEKCIGLLKISADLSLEKTYFEWTGSIPFSCFGGRASKRLTPPPVDHIPTSPLKINKDKFKKAVQSAVGITPVPPISFMPLVRVSPKLTTKHDERLVNGYTKEEESRSAGSAERSTSLTKDPIENVSKKLEKRLANGYTKEEESRSNVSLERSTSLPNEPFESTKKRSSTEVVAAARPVILPTKVVRRSDEEDKQIKKPKKSPHSVSIKSNLHNSSKKQFAHTSGDFQTKKLPSITHSPAKRKKKPAADISLKEVVKNIQEKHNQNKQTKFVAFHADMPAISLRFKRKSTDSISGEELAKRRKAADLLKNNSVAATTKFKTATTNNNQQKSPFKHKLLTTPVKQKENQQTLKSSAPAETKKPAHHHPLKSILRSCNHTAAKKKVTINLKKNMVLEIEEMDDPEPKTTGRHNVGGPAAQVAIDEKAEVSKMTLQDQLVYSVMQWNSAWLSEYKGNSATDGLPPIIDKQVFKKVNVPSFFVRYRLYVEILKPLYLCEIFEQAYQNFDKYRSKTDNLTDGIICSAKDIKTFLFNDFTVRAIVLKSCDDFQVETLVEFSLPDAIVDQRCTYLGFITGFGFSSQPLNRVNDILPGLRKNVDPDKVTDYKTVSFVLRMRAKPSVHRNYHGRVSFRKVLQMASFIRQIETMSLLQNLPFNSLVFDPPREYFFHSKIQSCLLKEKMSFCAKSIFNDDGPKLYSFSYDQIEKRISGVLDLVELIQQEKSCATDQTKVRSAILIVSSNQKSLDMISRLIVYRRKKINGTIDKNLTKFFRVGDKDEMDEDIWPYSLDELVDANLRPPTREDEAVLGNDLNISDIQIQIGHTKGRLAELEISDCPDIQEKSRLENAVRELEKKAKTCNVDRVSKSIRLRQKCTVIIHAEVIVVSLRQCFSAPLYNILMDANKPLRISCAIVDDASNIVELETLLPIRFGVDKFVLFGGCKVDEKSSGLVKSEVAMQCGFGSLFERIQKRRQN